MRRKTKCRSYLDNNVSFFHRPDSRAPEGSMAAA
jgi:hypothetical protein